MNSIIGDGKFIIVMNSLSLWLFIIAISRYLSLIVSWVRIELLRVVRKVRIIKRWLMRNEGLLNHIRIGLIDGSRVMIQRGWDVEVDVRWRGLSLIDLIVLIVGHMWLWLFPYVLRRYVVHLCPWSRVPFLWLELLWMDRSWLRIIGFILFYFFHRWPLWSLSSCFSLSFSGLFLCLLC